jgi:protein ImuB
MLWLCLSLPELPLECLQLSEPLIALIEKKGSRRWLRACTPDCHPHGVHAGLDAVSALALFPELRLVERSPKQESEALKALAAWAGQFSGFISFDAARLLLWLEIGSSLKLFGGLPKLRQQIEQGIVGLGYTMRTGVAPTLEAAALLSRFKNSEPILNRAAVLPRIEKLPLAALEIPAAVKDALHGSGLQTIGGVYKLGFDALARRFPLAVTGYLRRLTGQAPDPRKPWNAPATYRRRIEFLSAIESTETLLFPLRRMLMELQGYLIGRDTALQEFRVLLEHEDAAPTIIRIRSTRPQRDAAHLQLLIRERIQRSVIAGPALAIVMQVDHFVSLGDTQMDFFDISRRKDQEWLSLLDKMRARLGEQAICSLGLQDNHQPEKAWCTIDSVSAAKDEAQPLPRPLWLLPAPRRLQHLPQLSSRPERIEEGWWTGQDERRDYYIAAAADGSRLWLYRNAEDSHWYLHGIWA